MFTFPKRGKKGNQDYNNLELINIINSYLHTKIYLEAYYYSETYGKKLSDPYGHDDGNMRGDFRH